MFAERTLPSSTQRVPRRMSLTWDAVRPKYMSLSALEPAISDMVGLLVSGVMSVVFGAEVKSVGVSGRDGEEA